ncbi:helix-turn-helix transcriptional regulator [Pseudorhodobacter wandonensis]|uniref:helix-turn-helix transcriptional regulator n=1 Tax=Pseudorhodobacter wandonensis TaxID=1120568 RepID=UPI0009E423F2|nr:helix-turn-helix domain-containing protein [Pseudorhodobacter wandonensis]
MTQTVQTVSTYLSVAQVALRFGMSEATIWRWCRNDKFPKAYRLSKGSTRWRLSDIEAHESTLQACFVDCYDFQIAC